MDDARIIWTAALRQVGDGELFGAIASFQRIAPSALVLFNIAVLHAELEDFQTAYIYCQQAAHAEPTLAMAHFYAAQLSWRRARSSSRYATHHSRALEHARACLQSMGACSFIDYTQHGLPFVLWRVRMLADAVSLSVLCGSVAEAEEYYALFMLGMQRFAPGQVENVPAFIHDFALREPIALPARTIFRPPWLRQRARENGRHDFSYIYKEYK